MSNHARIRETNKSIYIVVLLAILMLSLSGCATLSEETTAPAAPAEDVVVIKYPTFQIGVNTAAAVVAQLVDDFNAEYAGQYQIEIEEIPGDQNYLDKLRVQIAAGEVPPVIYAGGNFLLDLALANDLVVDITEDVNADPEWIGSYDDAAMKVNARDDKIYASSNEGSLIGYFYNKEMFEAAGIDAPAETWDEFFEDLDALSAAGFTPLAMDTNGGGWVTTLLMGAMIATSGEEGLATMNTLYPTDYCTEPVLDALTKIQDMFANYTTVDAVGGGYENAANNFFSENVAIIANGPWMIGDFSDTTKTSEGFDAKVGAAVFPGPYVYSDVIEGYFVTKQDDPALEEASIAMVKFFTNADAQQLALEMQGMLPASPNVEITDAAKSTFPLLGEFLDLAAPVTARGSTLGALMLPGVGDVQERELSSLASGASTPEEFCQALSDAAAKAAE